MDRGMCQLCLILRIRIRISRLARQLPGDCGSLPEFICRGLPVHCRPGTRVKVCRRPYSTGFSPRTSAPWPSGAATLWRAPAGFGSPRCTLVYTGRVAGGSEPVLRTGVVRPTTNRGPREPGSRTVNQAEEFAEHREPGRGVRGASRTRRRSSRNQFATPVRNTISQPPANCRPV